MKKFVYLFFATLLPCLLQAQFHEEPPKIITEIDSIANWIDKHKSVPHHYSKSLKQGTKDTYVWLIDNRICKIAEFSQPILTPPNNYIIKEYYFSYNAPVLIRNSIGTKEINTSLLTDKQFDLNSSEFQKYYYDYYEIMSERVVEITDTDTIMVFNEVLKDAVGLLGKYKHLQNYNPYKNLPYDSIVAYDFMGDGDRSIVYKNKLEKSAKNPRKLSEQQTEKLIATVTDTATYGNGTAACFNPHLGFVFYHKGKIKSSINVCFGCNYLIADEYLPAHNHYNYLEVGDDYIFRFPQYGFSDQGKEKLMQFCEELGLAYCKSNPSPFEHITTPDKE